ncbi:asparaginase domain-containing protein [Formosa sp. L2A11]|uniref:asparaginase domain-containing protein n=1 Tax=Formosa sp. L2A11 TaxID=2686363 RepID=UPI00131D4B0F|nr:asparaginase domain-containing protein [Formosa sp. L2A11]
MKLIFIQTGGTIDKEYPHTTKGWAFEFGEPAAIRILEKLNPSFEYEIVTACQKDSLEITDNDRAHLATLINAHPEHKFIVTHGTDTMIETAKYLEAHVNNKLIVITGAMLPERFSNSDAPIQLGAAMATASLVESGVYIAMHGLVKKGSEIKRNLETGQYY